MYFIGPAFLFSSLFLSLSFLVPNHYHPWATAYNEFSAFFAFFLLAIAMVQRRLCLTLSSLFFSSVSIIPLAQWLLGIVFYSGDALMSFSYVLGFSASLMFGYALGNEWGRERVWAVLGAVFVLCGVVSVWIALRQWLGLTGSIWVADLPPGARPFANQAQPNNLSTLLCLGLVGVIYFFEKGWLGRVSSSVLAFFMLFGVALAQSRTAWVGGVFILAWWAWESRFVALRLRVFFLIVWLSIYTSMLLLLPVLSGELGIEVESLAERTFAFQRLDLWWQLWGALIEGPWWGYGWGQVGVAQAAVAMDRPVSIVVAHSHNVILDLLIWNGFILGGGVVLFVSFWILRLFWKVGTVEGVIGMSMVGFLLIHGMLEFPLEYAFFLLPAGIIIGLVEADVGVARVLSLSRSFQFLSLVLFFGLFSWLWREYRIIEEDFRLMRFEMAKVGSLKADAIAPDVVLLTQLREFIRLNRAPLEGRLTGGEIDEVRKISKRYPYASSLFRLATALAMNGKSNEAKRELLRLRALHGEGAYRESLQRLELMAREYPELASLAYP